MKPMTIIRLTPVLACLSFIVPTEAAIHPFDTGPHGNSISAVASAQPTTGDLSGTWTGTFISRYPNVSPFTITVKIDKNATGHLVGDASLVSDCLDSHRLEVTVNGSNVVLAGSDAKGDTVSFEGTVDDTGTVLRLKYIINGSPSGRCEIDNGTGSMGKR
jgi:hypothetical protein